MTDFKTRVYYRLEMTLMSPLAIGSGENINTDHDVMVDSRGIPFIPAAAITGVLRSYFADSLRQKEIFGDIDGSCKTPTQVMIYDGLICDDEAFFITRRDCVALEKKVSKKGAKFDLEAVEPGTRFVSILELLDIRLQETLEEALAALASGILRFGTKTTRGYGQVALKVSKKTVATYDEYIGFDMMNDWNEADDIGLNNVCRGTTLKLSLESVGGMSVREYSTKPNMPDYSQLALHDESGTPVIPGTSWAGAVRERFTCFAGNDAADRIFGYVDGKTSMSRKSVILFSETQLSGGTWKVITRNAIDRFSGATVNGALYTERTYYAGKGDLIVTMADKPDSACASALAACFADMHNGLLAVGGLTSVGRGLFRITSVNGKPVSDDEDIYETVKGALQ